MTVDALTVELGELVAAATDLPTSIDPIRPPSVPGNFVGPPSITPDAQTGGRVLTAQWEVGTVTAADTGAWSTVATTGEQIANAVIGHPVLGLVAARSILYTTPDGELPGYRIDVAVLLHAGDLEGGAPSGGARLVAVATLTADGAVVAGAVVDGAAAMGAVAVLTAAGAVLAAGINDGAATLNADATMTATGTVVAAAAWTPASLPAVARWYDPADLATITAAAGKVSAIANKVTPAAPAVNAAGTSQPATGTATVNGHNVLTFRGDAINWLSETTLALAQPVTFYLVFQPAAAGDDYRPIVDANTSPQFSVYGQPASGGATVALSSPGAADTLAPYGTALAQAVAVFNGAASAYYKNGTVTASGLNPGAGALAGLTIGSFLGHGYTFVGSFCELVVTNAVPTPADLTNWNAYTLAKWGV